MNKATLSFYLSILLLLVPLMSGCSLIGLGVGAAIDSHAPTTKNISPWEVHSVEPGENIIAYLEDGESFAGNYQGVTPLDDIDYHNKYDDFVSQLDDTCRMPILNEQVSITLKTGNKIEQKFLGFDKIIINTDKVDVSKFNFDNPDLYCYSIGESIEEKSQRYFLFDIKKYEGNESKDINRSCIWKMAVDGELPIRSAICITDSSQINKIGIEDVTSLEVKNSRNAKWWGLGLGLAADATLIILIATSMDSMNMGIGF